MSIDRKALAAAIVGRLGPVAGNTVRALRRLMGPREYKRKARHITRIRRNLARLDIAAGLADYIPMSAGALAALCNRRKVG